MISGGAYRSIAQFAAAVTPDDTHQLDSESMLFVGTGGDVAVVTVGGNTVTFSNVGDGDILPVAVKKVMSTNTTASDIVALW